MITHQTFLLISADAIKCIGASEAPSYLIISSSISWAARRYRDHYNRTQERMTSLQGIHPLTGDTVCVTVYPVLDRHWLLTVNVNKNRDAGPPSAATAPHSHCLPSRLASGRDRNHIPPRHIQSFYNSYLLARRGWVTLPDLPCREQKGPRHTSGANKEGWRHFLVNKHKQPIIWIN